MNITSIGQNLLIVRKKIIKIIKKINWNKGFYRSDIGWRIFITKKGSAMCAGSLKPTRGQSQQTHRR